MPATQVLLFDPDKMPARGMISSMSAAALPAGYWAQLTNVRLDKRTIRSREGSYKLTSAVPVSNASFKGSWEGKLDNTYYILAAYRVSSETRIYSLNTSTHAWTELTAASGKYGNTRFATDGEIYYQPIQDRANGVDLLVIQNGTDSPRILDPRATPKISTHPEIATPPDPFVQWSWKVNWPVTATNSFTNSGANFLAAKTGGTAQSSYMTLTAGASTATNDTAQINWSATVDFTQSKQLILLVEETAGTWWGNLQIEVGDGTLYQVIHSGDTDPIIVEGNIGGYPDAYYVAFPLDLLDKTVTSYTAANKLRFTWIGGTVSSPITMKIYLVAPSGRIPGGTQYAVSFYNSGARAESVAKVAGQPFAVWPESLFGTLLSFTPIPLSSLLYYTTRVVFRGTATVLADGVDTVNIYRMGPEESEFVFVDDQTIAAYSGSWAATGNDYFDDTVLDEARDVTKIAPDGFHRPIPRATAMTTANSRFIVGNIYDGTNYYRGDVWISEDSNPFRFRPAVRFLSPNEPDVTSPTRFTIPGEQIQAFTLLQDRLLSLSTILIFTDRAVWSLSGNNAFDLSRPNWLGPHGTIAPKSIARSKQFVYWLDNERQIRRMSNGRYDAISLQKVDDKLTDATLANASGAWINDRFYLTYYPSGGSGYTKILVYDERQEEFVEDVLGEGDARQIMTVDISLQRRLYYFTTEGHVYWHEKPSTSVDGSTGGVAIVLTSPDYHEAAGSLLHVERIAVMAEDMSATLNATRTYKPNGCVASSSWNMNVSDSYSWMWDGAITRNDENLEASGHMVQLSLSGSIPGNKSILKAMFELENRGQKIGVTA